jgi:hypothetical protein
LLLEFVERVSGAMRAADYDVSSFEEEFWWP